jgi:tetratricopeptide (TPR) repeat protein
MALDPNYAKLRKQARMHVEEGSRDNALKSATVFYNRYPHDAEANYEMSRALVRHDKKDVALNHAEMANKIYPSNGAYIYLVGRLYLDFSLYEFAAPLLRAAVSKLPKDLLVQWAMADFLFAIGHGHGAKLHYEAALALGPDSFQRPELLLDYARCLDAIALKKDAEVAYLELQQIERLKIFAISKRATLLKYLPDSDIAIELRKILEKKELDELRRSEILLALGNMSENAKNYDDAFELWTTSRALRTIDRNNDIGYGVLDEIKGFYSASLLDVARPFGHDSERPLFIVGMPRSGTTLTEQIISSHPEAFGVGELGRMHKLEKAFRRDYNGENRANKIIKNAQNGELRARAEETLTLLEVLAGPDAKRVVDKLPSQYLSMGYTHLCFPNARFIHCQRHPADSFISSFQNNMSQFHEYSFDQTVYAEAYLTKEKLMAHWRTSFADQIYDLSYEKLVSSPEQTVRDLLQFIGLPWDPKCMQFFEKPRTVKTFSHDQVRNPIYTSSMARWKNYEKHLGPLFAALKEAEFEYPEL